MWSIFQQEKTYNIVHMMKILFHWPMGEYPSWLQTTVASWVPHKSSHTVPQVWFRHNSTRPSVGAVPPTSLTSLFAQTEEYREVQVLFYSAHMNFDYLLCWTGLVWLTIKWNIQTYPSIYRDLWVSYLSKQSVNCNCL